MIADGLTLSKNTPGGRFGRPLSILHTLLTY